MTVEIDGANNIVKTNTISEVTSANGVTVDGLNIKDSKLVTADSVITTNVTDANITSAKINNDLISGKTALASEPADTDEFLVSDAGTLKRIDYSLIKGGVNTPNFKLSLTSNQSISNGTETKINFNSTEFDTASGWNSSSYKYIIPSGQGGLWFISTNARMSGGGNNTMGAGDLNLYKNNDTVAHVGLTPNTSSAMGIFGAYIGGIFNVSAADEIYVKAYITAGGARVDGEARFTALQGFKLIGA